MENHQELDWKTNRLKIKTHHALWYSTPFVLLWLKHHFIKFTLSFQWGTIVILFKSIILFQYSVRIKVPYNGRYFLSKIFLNLCTYWTDNVKHKLLVHFSIGYTITIWQNSLRTGFRFVQIVNIQIQVQINKFPFAMTVNQRNPVMAYLQSIKLKYSR